MVETRKTLLEQYYYLNPSFATRQQLGLSRLEGLGGWYQDGFGMKENGIDTSEIYHSIEDGKFVPRWSDNDSIYEDHEP